MSRGPLTPSAPFAVVVDDDPKQLDVLSGLVHKAGLEPRAFTGAEAALAAMSSGAVPALIVTDLYMPGLDGWRFCRLLRSPEYAALNQVPILVVSAAYADDEADRIAADLGVEAFFFSPVDGKRFVEQLRAILKGEKVRTPLRVLIVEDGKALAGKLQKAFEANGYEADTALTARAAVATFKKVAYDVVVLDDHLPDGTGDALLDTFRTTRPDCVCLMMTTDPGPELALGWMKRGAAAYLRKPFTPEYLVELCGRARREHALLRVQDLLEVRTRELRESEEKHRVLLAEAPDPIFCLTPEGRYTYANRAYAEGVGKPIEEIVGRSVWDVISKEEADLRFAALSQAFRAGEKTAIEGRAPQAGSDRDFITTIVPITDAAGTVIAAICSTKDITESKLAEEVLREREREFSTLVENAPDMIVRFDTDLRHVYCNAAVERHLGIPAPTFIGKTPLEVGGPREQAEFVCRSLRVALETGEEQAVEQSYQFPSGQKQFSTRIAPERDGQGSIRSLLAITRDITERKRTEAALHRSEEFLSVVFNNSDISIFVVEVMANGGYVYSGINPVHERLTGLRNADIVGKTPDALAEHQGPEAVAFMKARFDECVRTKKPLAAELYVPSGAAQGWWLARLTPIVDERTGRVVRLMGSSLDITERKRAEEELQASKVQLSNALEMAYLGHWEYDVANDVFTFNDQFYKIFRTTVEQVGGYAMPAAEYARRFVHPDDMDMVGQETRKAVETTDPHFNRQIEHRMLYADGTVGHIAVRFCIVKDSLGKTVKTYGVNQDITERKRAEGALRESEDRFSRAFQTSPYAITITHAEDGKFVEINDAFTTMTEFSREETLADSAIGLKLWVNEEVRRRIVSALGAGRAVAGQEAEFRTKSGKVITGLFSAQMLRLGQHPCILSSIADITAHKRAEEALRDSEEHYRSLVEGAPGIVYSYSSIHGGTFYSSRAADILGYSPEQLLANPKLWHDAIHPDDLPLVERSVVGAMAGTSFCIEYRIRDAHGDWRWLDDRSTQYRKKGAEVVIEGFALDITERKRAEAEKTALETQLQQAQKLESVGRLAGGVAHDFNNMLGVILGHTELALGQVDPAQSIHAYLKEIQQAAQRSTGLTRQLLAFARKQTIEPKVLDLNEAIAGMLKMLERLIGEDIDLKWQPGEALWPVKMDPSQLDQILANLCVNARDAIADVGKVTIKTGATVLDAGYCALHVGLVPGEYVRLAVSDDGCGMDKEMLARVFEPFFTTKAIGTGTGLGLAMIYGIVKQNGGFIDVYSEPGYGTTFAIYLPRHTGKVAQARTDGAAGPLARGHETVLLVEDEPAILVMTKEMLERQGYVVLAASTPGAGLRLAEAYTGEIHLLMTDVVMPEMNGRDLARNVLSLYPHIERLFMSGYTANVIAHHGVLDDGVHFLQKPFSMKDLAAKVREALEDD